MTCSCGAALSIGFRTCEECRTKNREHMREWRAENRERQLATDRRYRETHRAESNRRSRESARRTLNALRSSVFDILGRACVLCGYDDIRALDFDHIEGGGTAHRRLVNNYAHYYREMLDSPERFRVLCKNCNWIAHLESKDRLAAVR